MTNLINYIIIGLRVKSQKLENFKLAKPKGEILMTQKVEKKKATKLVVAIVHAGNGTSYASGTESTIMFLATKAAKEAKRTSTSVSTSFRKKQSTNS